MNNPLKPIKKFIASAFKTKEEKHKEFIYEQFNNGKILKVEGVKNE